MFNKTTKNIRQLFVGCIALFLMFSCNRSKENTKEVHHFAMADSVFSWIKASRNVNNPLAQRIKKLNKAHEIAEITLDHSQKTKYYSHISLAYLRLKDSASFRSTNKTTIALAKKTKDSLILAASYWDLAIFFRDHGISDSAYYHFERAKKIYDMLNNGYYSGRMLLNMAIVQADVKDYTGSEITTIKAIELLKPLEKNRQLYMAYNNLAIVANNLKEYERAIEYHQKALGYLKKLDEKNTLQQGTLNNIGYVYLEKGDYKKAVPYFQRILYRDNLLLKNPELYARAMDNLAYSNLKIGQSKNVKGQLLRALEIRDSIGDITGKSLSHYRLAEYFIYQQDTSTAIEHAQEAEKYAARSNNYERLLKTLRLMGRIDPKNAFRYTRRYIALNDSLQQEERQVRNKFARIRFETDEFIAENEILTRQKAIWIGVAIGLLVLGALVYIIVAQRAKNQKLQFQQQQQANNQEIFNLMLSQNQKVEEGKKMEQKRISEELHDGVLGKMLGARMVLTGLNKKEGEEAISERARAISALKEVEGEVRTISHELSHAAYQNIHNFIGTIDDLLKTIGDSAKIDCNFTYTDNVDWDGLTGEIKINLYRLVQESLQNAVKHSKCRQVVVNFDKEGDHLQALVRDDGLGFKVNKGKKGIGMRNMASRVDKLNGTWTIESSIGEGTTVTFKIPLQYYTIPDDKVSEENVSSAESV